MVEETVGGRCRVDQRRQRTEISTVPNKFDGEGKREKRYERREKERDTHTGR